MTHLNIHVDEPTYQTILEAINTRADQIENITDELEALFEIRQSMGPNPEANSGDEFIRVHFEKVNAGDAKKALHEGSGEGERNLNTVHETELRELAEHITV